MAQSQGKHRKRDVAKEKVVAVARAFDDRKAHILHALGVDEMDRSPKGSLDEPIYDLINHINHSRWYVTTSSCSGRVSLFLEGNTALHPPGDQDDEHSTSTSTTTTTTTTKTGKWLLVEHRKVNVREVKAAIAAAVETGDGERDEETMEGGTGKREDRGHNNKKMMLSDGTYNEQTIFLRFEPFILSVECRDITAANELLHVAKGVGFRESGLTMTRDGARLIVTVRSSTRLEAPILWYGALFVYDTYLSSLVDICNKKFEDNETRTNGFLAAFLRAEQRRSKETEKLTGTDEGWLVVKSLVALKRAKESLQKKDMADTRKRRLATVSGVSEDQGGANDVSKHGTGKRSDSSHPPVWKAIPLSTRGVQALDGLSGGEICAILGVPQSQEDAFEVWKTLPQRSLNDTNSAEKSLHKEDRHPGRVMKRRLCGLLSARGIDPLQLPSWEFPDRWDILGDLALIPSQCLRDVRWKPQWNEALHVIASVLRVRRIGRQNPIADDGTRTSQVELLLCLSGENGSVVNNEEDGWVDHVENGIHYGFDVTKCMFASGNGTERIRMAKLVNVGNETVLDLYCGIGYFTLPFLVHGGVRKVVACDWNPHAIAALRRNIVRNGIAADRVELLEGDNRTTLAHRCDFADRVCLGLIPSSVDGWPVAVRCLRSRGGWLHVHENVAEGEERGFMQKLKIALLQLMEGTAHFEGKIPKLETNYAIVKSYAPHINHIVVDVLVEITEATDSDRD